jgi:hypothetical protein
MLPWLIMMFFVVDKLGVEGKVIQRAECRPIADNNYLKLKR